MYSGFRGTLYAIMIFLLTLASAFTVIPARADNGAPPPAPAPSGPSTKSENTASLISNVPAGTNMVVMDRSGHKVALASQEAASIISNGDPIWCPMGVAPIATIGGCSPNTTKIGTTISGDLLNWLVTNDPNKAGVIWIEGNYVGGYQSSTNDPGITSFTFDGSTLTNMAVFSLAVKGGWTGTSIGTIDSTHPAEFDASLSIINWHAPVSISDIKVTGVTANPNAQPYALYVQTDQGGIALNRVKVMDNYTGSFAGGAYLDTSAATLLHPSPVVVNDSLFANNYHTGLDIEASGAVLLHGVVSDNNGGASIGNGAYIENLFNAPNAPVTLSGVNEFNGNSGNGAYIATNGAVTLNNITAYQNNHSGSGYGVQIINNTDSTASNVVLTGAGLFTYNAQDGLYILSNGNIILSNITSTDNQGNGAILNNCLITSLPGSCPTFAKSVTLTGVKIFNRNSGGTGLSVASSGVITISQVTANDNGDFGVWLDNCFFDGDFCSTPAPYNVTLMGASTFNGNASDGFTVKTQGAVSMKNITASLNGGYGVTIYNNYLLTKPRPVTIGGTNVLNGNYFSGLQIKSYGAITLSNITANDNGLTSTNGYGASLENAGYDSAAGGLGNPGATVITRMPVTLIGVNTFDHNYDDGLWVYSAGSIFASNLSASNNADGATVVPGVLLVNDLSWFPNKNAQKNYAANVTLSGFGTFDNNGSMGLDIGSTGAVTLANLTADNNGSKGVLIGAASNNLSPQNVTLTGVNTFYHNGNTSTGEGLYILSSGAITISNLTASANTGDGAYLDNFTWAFTSKFLGVTLTGYNTFQQNQGLEGLFILTDGSAFMSHINADGNNVTGVNATATKKLTLMCGNSYGNIAGSGFDLTSGATMTIIGVQSYLNNDFDHFNAVTLHQFSPCP
jgi:hypothetical protein